VTVQTNGAGDVDGAASDLIELIWKFCAATSHIAVLDRTRPTADF